MKRSNRLVILVGVLLAVLAFVAIVILLNQQEAPGPTTQEPETMTVLVAAEDIAIGQVVAPADVEERDIPVEAAQRGVLLDPSQLADRTALTGLPAGAQVTEQLFGGQAAGEVDIVGQLLPGEKAFAVQFDPVTGMNFLIEQGDTVDIVLSLDFASGTVAGSPHLRPNDTEIVRTVKTVLQNLRVLYVSATNIPPPPTVDEEGNEVPPPETATPSSIIVVFAGTNADAELFTFHQRGGGEVGAFTMVLRGDEDAEVVETPGVILADVFETYGVVIPLEVEELAAPDEEAP